MERKIVMVIQNTNQIDSYIDLNMANIDIYDDQLV